jgi:hypothetical protein
MISILVREMNRSELSLVLSSWKMQLADDRFRFRWGRRLDGESYWPLVNHVIDRITLPSCKVFVGCSPPEPDAPLGWVAIRPAKEAHEVVFMYARHEIRKQPEVAAALERGLLSEVDKLCPLMTQRNPFNPFQELRRR